MPPKIQSFRDKINEISLGTMVVILLLIVNVAKDWKGLEVGSVAALARAEEAIDHAEKAANDVESLKNEFRKHCAWGNESLAEQKLREANLMNQVERIAEAVEDQGETLKEVVKQQNKILRTLIRVSGEDVTIDNN
jgi:phage shock protein A